MRALIQATYGRPDHTCRKTITLNGGPFRSFVITLADIGRLENLLGRIDKECRQLSSPAIDCPHRLNYELDIWQPSDEAQQQAAENFVLPSLDEMSAFMDAEMARLGTNQGAAA